MRSQAKKAGEVLFHGAGGARWLRWRSRGLIRILMYHRFPGESRFAQQCAHLRKHYRPVSLTEAVHLISDGKPILDSPVVITIDDGYRDFLERAFPVLRHYGIPATVFLTTDLPDRNSWLWVDQLQFWFRHTRRLEIAAEIGGVGGWKLESEEQRARAARSIKEELKKMPNEERLEWLAKLPRLLDVEAPGEPPSEYAPLQWDDVRWLAGQGIEFGAHTRTHPILSRLSRKEEWEEEISGSKARIEAETKRSVRHFCYPNGRRVDVTPEIRKAVAEAGFACAVTSEPGLNGRGADLLELTRLGADPGYDDLFFSRLAAGYRVKYSGEFI